MRRIRFASRMVNAGVLCLVLLSLFIASCNEYDEKRHILYAIDDNETLYRYDMTGLID